MRGPPKPRKRAAAEPPANDVQPPRGRDVHPLFPEADREIAYLVVKRKKIIANVARYVVLPDSKVEDPTTIRDESDVCSLFGPGCFELVARDGRGLLVGRIEVDVADETGDVPVDKVETNDERANRLVAEMQKMADAREKFWALQMKNVQEDRRADMQAMSNMLDSSVKVLSTALTSSRGDGEGKFLVKHMLGQLDDVRKDLNKTRDRELELKIAAIKKNNDDDFWKGIASQALPMVQSLVSRRPPGWRGREQRAKGKDAPPKDAPAKEAPAMEAPRNDDERRERLASTGITLDSPEVYRAGLEDGRFTKNDAATLRFFRDTDVLPSEYLPILEEWDRRQQ